MDKIKREFSLRQVGIAFLKAIVVLCVLNLLAWPFSPKESVFWQNPLMLIYPVDHFGPEATRVEYNSNDDPHRSVRYIPDPDRWYRLDPEPKVPATGRFIANFGDSSTWGWGLTNRSYSYPEALNTYLPDSVRSINLGVPGYTSLQGLRYMEQFLLHYHERLAGVTIYFGNNDATENGLTDLEKLSAAQAHQPSLLNHLPLYRILRAGIGSLTVSDNRKPRVDPVSFGSNLRKMIQLAHSYNLPIVVIEPPTPLSWPPAHLTYVTSLEDDVRNDWVRSELQTATQKYRNGLDLVARGDDGYEMLLQEAQEHDWVVPRIKTAWRAKIINLEGIVSVVRIKPCFLGAEFPYRFEDYCHPTAQVHSEMAQGIARALGYHHSR